MKFYNLKNVLSFPKPRSTSEYNMLAYQSAEDSVYPTLFLYTVLKLLMAVSYELWLNKFNVITTNENLIRTMSICVSTTSLNLGVNKTQCGYLEIIHYLPCKIFKQK
jgi:hypothetical protein